MKLSNPSSPPPPSGVDGVNAAARDLTEPGAHEVVGNVGAGETNNSAQEAIVADDERAEQQRLQELEGENSASLGQRFSCCSLRKRLLFYFVVLVTGILIIVFLHYPQDQNNPEPIFRLPQPTASPSLALSPNASALAPPLASLSSSYQWIQFGQDLIGNYTEAYSDGHASISGNGNRVAVCSDSHLWIYEWNATTESWELIDSFSGPFSDVALDDTGNRIAMGVDDESGFHMVAVFEYDTSTGIGMMGDVLPDRYFTFRGLAISADGSRVAYGDVDAGPGRVYIYDWNSETQAWERVATLSGDRNGTQFGNGVAMSGDGTRIVIGAYFGAHAVVYEASNSSGENEATAWNQLGQTLSAHSYVSQVAMSRDGSTLAVADALSLQVYRWNNQDWQPLGTAREGLSFPTVSLSANGQRVIVGDYWANDNQGVTRVYSWDHHDDGGGSSADNKDWMQMGDDIEGENPSYSLGGATNTSFDERSILGYLGATDISSDGARILVGGYGSGCQDESLEDCALARVYNLVTSDD